MSAVAELLATLYNDSSHRPEHCEKVEYLKALVVEDVDVSTEEDDSPRCVVEPVLPVSEFTKFSNNAGL